MKMITKSKYAINSILILVKFMTFINSQMEIC